MRLYSIWWVCFCIVSASIIGLSIKVTNYFSQTRLIALIKAEHYQYCEVLKILAEKHPML